MQRLARHAGASPGFRAAAIRLLNRAPAVKRRLKRTLARANTLASQRTSADADAAPDEPLLSQQARRVLNLHRARAHSSAQRVTAARVVRLVVDLRRARRRVVCAASAVIRLRLPMRLPERPDRTSCHWCSTRPFRSRSNGFATASPTSSPRHEFTYGTDPPLLRRASRSTDGGPGCGSDPRGVPAFAPTRCGAGVEPLRGIRRRCNDIDPHAFARARRDDALRPDTAGAERDSRHACRAALVRAQARVAAWRRPSARDLASCERGSDLCRPTAERADRCDLHGGGSMLSAARRERCAEARAIRALRHHRAVRPVRGRIR